MIPFNDMAEKRRRLRDEKGRFARERSMQPHPENTRAAEKEAVPDLSPAATAMLSHVDLPADVLAGSLEALDRELSRQFGTPELDAARKVLMDGPHDQESIEESYARIRKAGFDEETSYLAVVLGLPSESFVGLK